MVPESGDPSEVVEARESIRLAFVAALQHLPPRQRAVLILREVLRWKASEVAELLDTSVASVNSALQRARATLASVRIDDAETLQPADDDQRALLARYVDAFERYDMDSLTSLLREDATWSMPPYEMWLQTHDDIGSWCLGPGIGCRGSRLIAVEANGMPAFGQYKPGADGGLEPWSLQVLEISDGQIVGISFFLDTERLFPHVRARPTPRRLTRPDPTPHTGRTSRRPDRTSSSTNGSRARRSSTRYPRRRAVSWSRASASIVTASGSASASTSHETGPASQPASSLRARSHSAGMPSRVTGPIMMRTVPPGPGRHRRATGCVADDARAWTRGRHPFAVIDRWTGRVPRTHRGAGVAPPGR